MTRWRSLLIEGGSVCGDRWHAIASNQVQTDPSSDVGSTIENLGRAVEWSSYWSGVPEPRRVEVSPDATIDRGRDRRTPLRTVMPSRVHRPHLVEAASTEITYHRALPRPGRAQFLAMGSLGAIHVMDGAIHSDAVATSLVSLKALRRIELRSSSPGCRAPRRRDRSCLHAGRAIPA